MSKEKITIVGFLIFFAVACGTANSKTIRQSDYGDKWPLTVSEATLLCKGGLGIYIYVNERYYPVNGSAQAQWIIDRYIGEPIYNLEDIWAYHPVYGEEWASKHGEHPLRISIGPLIDDGLKLCK